jgi:hypothetical protein
MSARLFLSLVGSILVLAAVAGCYDASSPNLPPCARDATWPDPCSGAMYDAGPG